MAAKKSIQTKTPQKSIDFPLTAENYKLMAIGFGIIVIGFVLMIGGKAATPDEFNPEIFNFRRLTLAPLVVIFGYAFEIYAIMKRPDEKPE